MYENYFNAQENAAYDSYSNFGGWDNFSDQYDYAGGAGVSVEPSASLPFIILISNSTTDDVTGVKILGANANAGANNNGNVAAITISLDSDDVTYSEFLQSIKSEPFKVGLMQLQSSNTSQPFKRLTITNKESNGRKTTLPVTPTLDPNQNQAGVTNVRYAFPVNAFTEITTTILASATLTMRLYPMAQLDIARGLSGQSVEKAYAKPNLYQIPGTPGVLVGR